MKHNISKKLRDLVWITYVGRNFEGECYSCLCKIDVFNFHAGHIIPECMNGELCLENLRPICITCNLSMGKKNMKEFIIKNNLPGIKNFNINRYQKIGDMLIKIN